MVSLLVTAAWKWIVIRGEIKRENIVRTRRSVKGPAEVGIAEDKDIPVTEISSIWVGLGILSTAAHPCLSFTFFFTRKQEYDAAKNILLPFSIVLYTLSFAAQPRR